MRFLFVLLLAFVLTILFQTAILAQFLTHGPIVGGVTHNSASFVVRTDGNARIAIELATNPEFSDAFISLKEHSREDNDFWARVPVKQLRAQTRYYYRAVINGESVPNDTPRSFTSFPEPGTVSTFTFLTGSCQQNPRDAASNIGSIFPIMANEDAAFLTHQGDWGYPDTTDTESNPENYYSLDYSRVQSNYRSMYDPAFPMDVLLAKMPVAYTYDDHDYVNNNADGTYPGKANAIAGYSKMFPGYPRSEMENGIWHKFSYGNIDVFMVDNRSQRDPNLDAFTGLGSDSASFNPGPDHSILGDEQMAWLLSELAQSTADWKFISSGTTFNPGIRAGIELTMLLEAVTDSIETPRGKADPLDIAIGFSDVWAAFPADIERLTRHVLDNEIENVIFLSGDSHNSGIDDGSSSIFPEMMAGPLDRRNSETVALLESVGVFVYNQGGHTIDQLDFGNAYGRVTVFGADSVRLEAVSENGGVLGSHTVADGYLPAAVNTTIAPAILDFSDTPNIGFPAIQAAVIISTGIAALTVSNLEIIGDDNFSVLPLGSQVPFAVEASDKALLAILYSPGSVDVTHSAILRVSTTAPKQSTIDIILSGSGATPEPSSNENTADEEIADNTLPESFSLLQNYPNPFNPATAIPYLLPKEAEVIIRIYDVNGRLVQTMNEGLKPAGWHTTSWNGLNANGEAAPSAFYFYRMETEGFSQTRKMLLVR